MAAGIALLLLLFMVVCTGVAVVRLQQLVTATRVMLDTAVTKERFFGDWYHLVYAGIRRASVIAKSSAPSLSAIFAKETAAVTRLAQIYITHLRLWGPKQTRPCCRK